MRSPAAPPHLLSLDHPLADYLVDRRLRRSGRNLLAVAPPLAEIWDQIGIVVDVGVKLLRSFLQFRAFFRRLTGAGSARPGSQC